MDYLVLWVKQIFVISIISDIVIHIVPSDKYEKYIKYICGIIMIAVCISPVYTLLNNKYSISQLYEEYAEGTYMQKMKNELQYSINSTENTVVDGLKQKIEKNIDEFILEEGCYPASTQVVIETDENSKNYGNIKQINLKISMNQYENCDMDTYIQIEKVRIDSDNVVKDSQYTEDERVKMDEIKKKFADYYKIDLSCINVSIVK